MTIYDWPFSRIQNNTIPKGCGTIHSGPDAERMGGGTDRRHADVWLSVTDPVESSLWERLPNAIAILGCGSGAASISCISLPINDCEWNSINEVILGAFRIHFQLFENQEKTDFRCRLGPGSQRPLPEWLKTTILAAANALPGGTAERTAVAAGLHLLYDDLDGSHSLAQTVEGRGKSRNGDYWHAIMHRREPDYDNAKYWFCRVGAHPVMTELPAVVERVRQEAASPELDRWAGRLVKNGVWDAFAFVDACEAASGRDADAAFVQALEEIQHYEMLHLLVQSCTDANVG